MKMPWKKPRKMTKERQRINDYSDMAIGVAQELVALLRREPITVRHDIHRNIPRPTAAELVMMDDSGQQYRQYVDMTFKHTMRVWFPLNWATGNDEDRSRQFFVEMHLQYPEGNR